MEGADLLKFGLIGGAAYLAYSYYASPASPAVTTTPVTGTTPAPAATGTTTAPAVTAPTINAAMLDDAATKANYPGPHLFNAYQWNYFYTVVTGRATDTFGPSNLFPGDPETATYTSDQYIAALKRLNRGLAAIRAAVKSAVSPVVLSQHGVRYDLKGWS